MILLPYPPSANRYWRTFRGRHVRSADAVTYRGEVMSRASIYGLHLLRGPVKVLATLHPKLTRKGVASLVRIDLDNCVKVVLDALQGVAYDNDNQIEDLHLLLGPAMSDGGLTVHVEAMPG